MFIYCKYLPVNNHFSVSMSITAIKTLKLRTRSPSDANKAQAPSLPLEICLMIFNYSPSTTDRFRLACTNRAFAQAARLAAAWPDLNVRCVGVKLSRSGRKILPSEESFLEDLGLFLKQRRFKNVKYLDASCCHLGEPVSFFRLLFECLPLLTSLNLSRCGPDFHWGFLRWDRIPSDVHSAMLMHPALGKVVYGAVVWLRVEGKFLKFSNASC